MTTPNVAAAEPDFRVGSCLRRVRELYLRDLRKMLLTSLGVWMLLDVFGLVTHRSGGVGTSIGVVYASALMVIWSGDRYRDSDASSQKQAASKLRLGSLFGTSFVSGLAILAGLVLFIVPGILIGALWSLHQPVIVREGVGLSESLSRSWSLVRPQMWSVAAVWLIVVLLIVASALIGGLVATGLGGSSSWAVYDWQTFLTDAIFIAPVFPLLPLTAAATYDLVAQ